MVDRLISIPRAISSMLQLKTKKLFICPIQLSTLHILRKCPLCNTIHHIRDTFFLSPYEYIEISMLDFLYFGSKGRTPTWWVWCSVNAAGPLQHICLGLTCEPDWQTCAMMAKQLSSFPSHLKHITLVVISVNSQPVQHIHHIPNCNPAVDLHWTYKIRVTHTNLIRSTKRKASFLY